MRLTLANTHAAVSNPQLEAALEIALGLTRVRVGATATEIHIDHPALTEAHRAACQAVISAYVFDPLYGADPPEPDMSGRPLVERVAALEAKLRRG